jgi:tetratricopeptide (TPR) repeat protein
MGFTARKSFKVMPGVRMTVSKRGVSTSVGVRGARVTRTAAGRVTRTVGLPGTGIRHTQTIGGSSSRSGSSSSARDGAQSAPTRSAPALPKPGFTAPKWEKELHKAITEGNYGDLPKVAQNHPEVAPLAAALDGIVAYSNGEHARAIEVLAWAWGTQALIEDHPFTRKYLASSTITLQVADGVTAVLPLSRDAVGLALAELHQEAGNLSEAIAVVEALDPSTIAAVSLAELYIDAARYDDVVELTNGLTNIDDTNALLVTFRGIALREQGHYTAAREAFKEGLKSKTRDAAIRHRALLERAESYKAEGKASMARKDLERVLAEDSNYPGLQEALRML